MSLNTDFIPFYRASIDKEEEKALIAVLRSGWLTTGKITQEFECQFKNYVKSTYAIAVNSATAGLHLSLEAIGIKPGDRVITTPFTFTATAEVIRYFDAEVVFVDIDERTGNINTDLIETAIGKVDRIKAIIPVHFAGLPCEMKRIKEIALRHSLKIVEDSAHAFPVKVTGGKYAGTVGDTGVYSFYVTKPITSGEGGMVVTDSKQLAERIKVMRLHGIDRDVFDRYTKKTSAWKYDVIAPGYKYNLTDMASAIGLIQLKKAEEFLLKRTSIAEKYIELLSDYDFLSLPLPEKNNSWHLFTVLLNLEKISISRDEFIEKILERKIGVSVHFIPLHTMTYYRKRYGFKPEDFPASLHRYHRSISLPIYPELKDSEIEYICKSLIDIGTKHYKNHSMSSELR